MGRRYVALLRGVNNIGAARPVAMADLRALFEALGFERVRTVLNSGNVVFSADEPRAQARKRIVAALAAELKVTSPVTLLSAAEVASAFNDNPLARVAIHPSKLLLVVPRERADLRRLAPLLAKRWNPERLALGPRVAYVWCGNGIPRSPLWNAVDRALERTGTARNLATFGKLMALVTA